MVVEELRSGKLTAEGWEEFCAQRGMAAWALVEGNEAD